MSRNTIVSTGKTFEKMSEDTKNDTQETKKQSGAKKKNKKWDGWPLQGIKEPHEHDVLYGRGGGTNHHSGNIRYRKMVEERKLNYFRSKKLDKPKVAREIVRKTRSLNPPGRFLKLNARTELWDDVGNDKAIEKAKQALREGAPELRDRRKGGMKTPTKPTRTPERPTAAQAFLTQDQAPGLAPAVTPTSSQSVDSSFASSDHNDPFAPSPQIAATFNFDAMQDSVNHAMLEGVNETIFEDEPVDESDPIFDFLNYWCSPDTVMEENV